VFLAALARLIQQPGWRYTWRSALWLAAGLLTKAYFLAFVPLALAVGAVLVWRRRVRAKMVLAGALLILALAGPWYLRNLALYHNLSGTHEEFDGIGVRQALAAAPRIDWVATAGFLARGSLWTGNNSFTTFSRTTLNIMLLLLLAAVAAWGIRIRSSQTPERVLFGAIVLFSLAVAYASWRPSPTRTAPRRARARGTRKCCLSRWRRLRIWACHGGKGLAPCWLSASLRSGPGF